MGRVATPPTRSLSSSHVVPRRAYGAYWTYADTTCAPGGASDGSVTDGIVSSIQGSFETPPYLAASNARSIASTLGASRIRPDSAPGDCFATSGSAATA